MTQQDNKPKPLQLLYIHRKKVYAVLVVAGVLAIVVASCNYDEANESIDAVFYQTTAQCEADINQQQAEYVSAQQQYQNGQLDEAPTAPPMQAQDCAPQMAAATAEHEKAAPIYNSLADCQAEGVQCEATPAGVQAAGYRPIYGGTYIDPDDSNYTYVYYGNSQHRVYQTHSVYLSSTPGNVVTPYGREISQTTTGRVSVPRHTAFTAPARPAGTSGSGTIRGRSSQGFGSSFKSTGRGGK
ncbi:DUF1190 domain-containing protein [Chamaesiphon sp. GL140_3_metabinner_50]|uniref:DUF1190 domain-containing protein n=1 Tax=Chamaesiphon sp. GL140_3_metabinner_50 TaxID=2970812 RepID=UPI0025F97019|nr:DUF1190 domain-containing protein [Chamaesiphon sp. GL140_3_metabinner_50]